LNFTTWSTLDLEDFSLLPPDDHGPALHVVLFVNGWLQRELNHEDDEEPNEQDEQEGDEDDDLVDVKTAEQEQQQTQSATQVVSKQEDSSALSGISSWKTGFNLAERALKATGEVCSNEERKMLTLLAKVVVKCAVGTGTAVKNAAVEAGNAIEGAVTSVAQKTLPEMGVGESHPWHCWTEVQVFICSL